MPRTVVSALVATLTLAVTVVPAGAAGKNRWITGKTWVIAHQGGEDEFPSNTLYAFKRAQRAGVDMLELDIGVTKDNKVIVMHDTSVDRVTNGTGLVSQMTLRQIEKLDGAYWFSGGAHPYDHDKARSAYRFRGVATGKRRPPAGYSAADFRVPTLSAVIKAFPRTPINVEIKGRTKDEAISEYLTNARVLAKLLKPLKRRDINVVSFKQEAVDLFSKLDPKLDVAPGVSGASGFLLMDQPLSPQTKILQLPFTYILNGGQVEVGTQAFIAKAHAAGLAWQSWFADQDVDGPALWGTLISRCADGIMTSQPLALLRFSKTHRRPASCPQR